MAKYICDVCGWEFETEEIPADFVCPICGVGKDEFSKA